MEEREGEDTLYRWMEEKEIEDQFTNYQRLMDFMNNKRHRMKIQVKPHPLMYGSEVT